MTALEFLSKLESVRPTHGGWMARCPAHDDRNPSLSVCEEGSKILLRCHAGCKTSDIVSALGLSMSDLFLDSKPNGAGGKPEAVYPYTDEEGRLLFEVVRFPGKQFRQRRPDGKGGWVWNLGDVRRVLFNLPAVMKERAIVVCEGEKDCLTAGKLGLTATCNPHGAGKWREEYSALLKGKRVAIIADADAPGLAHARDVARSLVKVAESVRLIEALPQSKDLTEWVEHGEGDLEGAREQLLEIIRESPILTAEHFAKWQRAKAASGFILTPLGDLLARPDAPVEYVCDGRLVAGTVSGVFAKPKVGKGTLARNLCLCISRGEDFLGFPTKQGECIYLALEEREEDIKRDFRAMSADGTEPIFVHAAAAPAQGIRALCDLVRERRPRLVVIDPIIRLARIREEKAYAEIYNALGPLIDAARESGTHVMILHHSGKTPKADAIDSPLGSTGFAGIVSTLLVLKRTEAYRTVQTVQRIGADMPETVLQFDPQTKRLSIGGTREEVETQTLSGEVLEFLQAGGESKTEPEITEGVEGKTKYVRRALRELVKDGKVSREGAGRRGDPYRYRFSFSCSQHIPGTREQEMQKAVETGENKGPNLVPTSGRESFLVPSDSASAVTLFARGE